MNDFVVIALFRLLEKTNNLKLFSIHLILEQIIVKADEGTYCKFSTQVFVQVAFNQLFWSPSEQDCNTVEVHAEAVRRIHNCQELHRRILQGLQCRQT